MIVLPLIDLTNAASPFTLGLGGAVFQKVGWMVFLNESPYTLYVQAGGLNKVIPSWDEYPVQISDTRNGVYQVLYGATDPITVRPVYLVSPTLVYPSYALQVILYFNGETPETTVPRSLQRQSFIPNSVSTNVSGSNTLSNEGLAANTQVIDMGDTTQSLLFTLFNDGHCTWSVDQAGTVHQVLKVQTSGNPLQLGKSGDTTEVLGNGLIDGTLTVTGDTALNGAGTSLAVANNQTVGGTLTVTGDTALNGAGTSLAVANNQTVGGTLTVTGDTALNGAGTSLAVANDQTIGGALTVTGDTTLNGAGTSLAVANNVTVGGTLAVTGASTLAGLTLSGTTNITFEDSSHLKTLHHFTGTGSGTVATGCSAGPDGIAFDPCTVSGSSQTLGGTVATSTHVTTGAGLAWAGIAFQSIS